MNDDSLYLTTATENPQDVHTVTNLHIQGTVSELFTTEMAHRNN